MVNQGPNNVPLRPPVDVMRTGTGAAAILIVDLATSQQTLYSELTIQRVVKRCSTIWSNDRVARGSRIGRSSAERTSFAPFRAKTSSARCVHGLVGSAHVGTACTVACTRPERPRTACCVYFASSSGGSNIPRWESTTLLDDAGPPETSRLPAV